MSLRYGRYDTTACSAELQIIAEYVESNGLINRDALRRDASAAAVTQGCQTRADGTGVLARAREHARRIARLLRPATYA